MSKQRVQEHDQGERKPRRKWEGPRVRRADGRGAETGIDIGPELTLILS